MTPSLSIIIPSYNEEQLLPHCLNSILRQKDELGPRGEIIVVVNGSTDNTLEVAQSYSMLSPLIKVLYVNQASKKLAMNAGLDIAANQYIVFIDADSSLEPQALSEVNRMLQKNQYSIVGAIRKPVIDMHKVNVQFPETYFMLHYARRLSLKAEDRLSVQGWLMAVDLNKFYHLRFPLDNSPDDIWLSAHTWTLHGAQSIGYIPHALGTYIPPTTIKDMERQILRHRSNHKSVQKFHPELSQYFLARRAYYGTVKSNVRWRRASTDLGINFNDWVVPYKKFSTYIDNQIDIGDYNYGETASWDRISSSKSLNQK